MIGRELGQYRILERLGEGAMGEVFLAQDRRLERPVALKILRRTGGDAAALRERLLAEARAASGLSHPNVAVVYEVGEVESEGERIEFLALEYVAGEPLDRWAERERPGVERMLTIGIQVADALAAAHARGFVHRDLKPSNLLVAEGDRVKVVDFGVAAAGAARLADLSTWTRAPADGSALGSPAGEIAGTLLYMAPEQALGRPFDGRADLYGLGAVLYELAAGEHPFRAPSWAATLDAVLHREPPPLASSPGDDPRREPFGRLLLALLAKQAADRPRDAASVAAALRAIRDGDGAGEAAAGEAARRGLALLPFANLSGRPEDDWIGAGIVESLASDLGAAGLDPLGRARVEEAARRHPRGAGESEPRYGLRLGRLLGARWALVGAVQRMGARVRVTAQLLGTSDGAALAALKHDGELDAIFALQDRLAQELAARLAAAPVAGAPQPAGEETTVVAAYEALSRGLLNLRTETYEGLDRAILYFERAVAADPRYVRALVELGAARAQQADYLGAGELHERALLALRTALALAPGEARVHRELGATLVAAGRDDEGIAELERALELAPAEPAVLSGMARALFLARGDFAGAAGFFLRALERNPLAGWYWLQLAHCQSLARELDGARAAAHRAVDLQERFLSGQAGQQIVGAHMRLGHVAALEGRHEEAVRHFRQELAFLAQLDHALRGRIQVELNLRLGASLAAAGERERAAAHLEAATQAFERRLAMGADEAATRYYAAGAWAVLGERERALAELGRAIAARPRLNRARARIEPEFAGLRDDPEFRALVGVE